METSTDSTTRASVSELVLVRHGQSIGNLADRKAIAARAARLELDLRDADVPLSEDGQRQAGAVREWLRTRGADERPTVVMSSPYERALATARTVTGGLVDTVAVDERLRERELGVFDGLTWYGIEAEYPDEARRRQRLGKFYYRPPGGESWCDVVLRVRQLLIDLAADHAGQRLWVFTHQAVIMSFRVALENLGEREILDSDKQTPLANCSLTRYRLGDSGRLELVAYGDSRIVDVLGAPVTHEKPEPMASTDA